MNLDRQMIIYMAIVMVLMVIYAIALGRIVFGRPRKDILAGKPPRTKGAV